MVPIARMSPPESNVCFAISIDAGTSNSFAPIGIQLEFRRSGSFQGDEVCSAAYPGPRMQPTKEAKRLGPPPSCGGEPEAGHHWHQRSCQARVRMRIIKLS